MVALLAARPAGRDNPVPLLIEKAVMLLNSFDFTTLYGMLLHILISCRGHFLCRLVEVMFYSARYFVWIIRFNSMRNVWGRPPRAFGVGGLVINIMHGYNTDGGPGEV